MNYKEIMYFLRTSRPSFNMHLYQSAASYFIFNKTGSQPKLHSKRTYNSLRNKGRLYFVGYYIFAMLGLSLLQIVPELKVASTTSFITSLLFVIGFLFIAAMCASAQIKTEKARELLISIEYDNS